ncbi:MAG: PilZ domain-containing protein [Pseudomonadota bacterium]
MRFEFMSGTPPPSSDQQSPDNQDQEEPSGDERRRHARVSMNSKARVLHQNGEEAPAILVNISAGGALLKAKVPPAKDERVVLYIDNIGRFEGKVIRSGQHLFAVDYRGRKAKTKRTADALTIALNQAPKGADRRHAPRIRQDKATIVTLESGETQPCSIIDISLTGASIEIDPKPELGTPLTVGKMKAKVVRRHDKGVGVVFTGPAQKMDDVIAEAQGKAKTDPTADFGGANIAPSFGKKSADV